MSDIIYRIRLANLKIEPRKLNVGQRNADGVVAGQRILNRDIDNQMGIAITWDDNMERREGGRKPMRLRNVCLYFQPIGTWIAADSQIECLLEDFAFQSRGQGLD